MKGCRRTGDGGRSKTCESSIRSRAVGEYERRNRGGIRTRLYSHVITVLYRYNTVRNDLDLKIMIKNTKTETATGSIYEHDEERANPRSPKEDRRHIRRY
jgi:hypothetical protein